MKRKILGLGIILLILIPRIYKLDTSTHFLSDESRDLVNIHQIWVEHKLTLVGPISDDRSHAFSSLTYYMLLPFAAVFNFDPLGTVFGATVWGIIAAILVIILIFKVNQKLLYWGSVFTAIWYPLLQTSRWPWNPNLLIFWEVAGLLTTGVWSGLAFGLAVHHHYLALLPAVFMVIKRKDWKMIIGLVIALLPFLIFDLRHPPGIFIMRMIDYNRGPMQQSWVLALGKLPELFKYFFDYIFQVKIISAIGIILVAGLIIWDFIRKSRARSWAIIWAMCLVPLVFYSTQFQYLLPAIPFFLVWVFTQRIGWGAKLAKSIIALMIIGSIFTLNQHFNQPDWSGNLSILRGGTKIIAEQIIKQKSVNANLAVLNSPDIYPAGKKFRDLLLVQNIRTKTYEAYETSDNLYVVTTGSTDQLRKDPASELIYFRNGPVAGEWQIEGTNWKVIQINKY